MCDIGGVPNAGACIRSKQILHPSDPTRPALSLCRCAMASARLRGPVGVLVALVLLGLCGFHSGMMGDFTHFSLGQKSRAHCSKLNFPALFVRPAHAAIFTLKAPLNGGFCQIATFSVCRISWLSTNFSGTDTLRLNLTFTAQAGATAWQATGSVSNVNALATNAMFTDISIPAGVKGQYQMRIVDAASGTVLSTTVFTVVGCTQQFEMSPFKSDKSHVSA